MIIGRIQSTIKLGDMRSSSPSLLTLLEYTTAAKTLQLAYDKTTLLYERLHKETTGLDSLAVRPDVPGDPQVPITSSRDTRDLTSFSLFKKVLDQR
jgi:hypothetical protein